MNYVSTQSFQPEKLEWINSVSSGSFVENKMIYSGTDLLVAFKDLNEVRMKGCMFYFSSSLELITVMRNCNSVAFEDCVFYSKDYLHVIFEDSAYISFVNCRLENVEISLFYISNCGIAQTTVHASKGFTASNCINVKLTDFTLLDLDGIFDLRFNEDFQADNLIATFEENAIISLDGGKNNIINLTAICERGFDLTVDDGFNNNVDLRLFGFGGTATVSAYGGSFSNQVNLVYDNLTATLNGTEHLLSYGSRPYIEGMDLPKPVLQDSWPINKSVLDYVHNVNLLAPDGSPLLFPINRNASSVALTEVLRVQAEAGYRGIYLSKEFSQGYSLVGNVLVYEGLLKEAGQQYHKILLYVEYPDVVMELPLLIHWNSIGASALAVPLQFIPVRREAELRVDPKPSYSITLQPLFRASYTNSVVLNVRHALSISPLITKGYAASQYAYSAELRRLSDVGVVQLNIPKTTNNASMRSKGWKGLLHTNATAQIKKVAILYPMKIKSHIKLNIVEVKNKPTITSDFVNLKYRKILVPKVLARYTYMGAGYGKYVTMEGINRQVSEMVGPSGFVLTPLIEEEVID